MFKKLNYKKKKILMLELGGGLCNRLIGLNNAIHLLKRLDNLELRVVWWKEPECGCKFEDILKPIPGIPIINYARPMETQMELLRKGKLWALLVAMIENCFFKYYYRESNKDRIAGFWSDIEDVTEEKLISSINSFAQSKIIYYRMGVKYRTECILSEGMFSDSVIDKANCVRELFGNRGYMGLHIRRTDHKLAIEASPLSFFEEAIEREICKSGNIIFYLATDDKKVEEKLKERYGEKIVVNEACIRGRRSSESIQDAAVDLIMLAGAVRIYGSVGSTFSEMAAEMGHKPLILPQTKDLYRIVEKDYV